MAVAITMPLQKDGIDSCYISEWHRQVGDTVAIGDLLYSYETAKEALDETAKNEGTLLAIFAEVGDDVPCGQNIAVIGQPGEDFEAFRPIIQAEEAPAASPLIERGKNTSACPAALEFDPEAQLMADRHFVDPSWISPSGDGGLVLACDVQAAIDAGKVATPAAYPLLNGRVQGTGLGGRVRLKDVLPENIQGKNSFAYLHTQALDINMTEVLRIHAQYRLQCEKFNTEPVTINDLFLKAAVQLLSRPVYAALNAIDGVVPLRTSHVGLGMSIKTDRGLATPALRLDPSMTLREISREAHRTIAFCRSGYMPDGKNDRSGFLLHNAGAAGIADFTPGLARNQAAALGICAISKRAGAAADSAALIPHVRMILAYWNEGSVTDALAMRFLTELKQSLECPASLFV